MSIFRYLYFLQVAARTLSAYRGNVLIVLYNPSIRGKGRTNFYRLARGDSAYY